MGRLAVVVGLLFMFSCGAPLPPPTIQVQAQVAKESDDIAVHFYSEKIAAYYALRGVTGRFNGDPHWIRLCVNEKMRWARFFKTHDSVQRQLMVTHTESWLDPEAIGKNGERGMDQINVRDKRTMKAAADIFKEFNIKPGGLDNPRWQLGYGAALWLAKLRFCKGDQECATVAWNGTGKPARAHADRVINYEKEIFGENSRGVKKSGKVVVGHRGGGRPVLRFVSMQQGNGSSRKTRPRPSRKQTS